MQRIAVELLAFGHLDDFPEIHHRDAVGDVFNHRQVVRNEEVGELEFVFELREQIDDLGLDRDVQRRDRLVQHHELGLKGERPGDADALPLAPGKLVRVAIQVGRVEAHFHQDFLDAVAAFGFGSDTVDPQPFLDDPADGHAGIQGAERILKDDLHIAAELPQRRARAVGDVFAAKVNRAARRFVQAQQRAADRRFAAAAFADESQRFAGLDGERDVIHGVDVSHHALQQPLPHRKVLFQVADFQQWWRRWGGHGAGLNIGGSRPGGNARYAWASVG